MSWKLSSSHKGARLIASVLAASALGLSSVAAASAQQLAPTPVRPSDPVNLPPIRSASASGDPSPSGRGVTLEQARAALLAATKLNTSAKPSADVVPSASAATTITAINLAPSHNLAVMGTSQNDTITISRDGAGRLLVNNGAVPILGPTATVANTTLISVFGLDGNDSITLNEANGPLPNADLFGGAGNDTLTGGSGADDLFGESGDDTLLGKGGNDLLSGGSGSDTLTGGAGDDQVSGESGDDRFIWNPGDGSDLNEGGDGIDTIEVNGGNGAETFSAVPNGARVRFDRLTPGPFFIDIGTAEKLVVNMNGGDDTFTGANGLATLIQLTVDGGPGNDTITGGDGADLLLGGDGNDTINGGRGNDTVLLGAGDDTFVWNPGDGSDIVEGEAGTDIMRFNGANIAEEFDISANGQRVRFTRNIASIVMDLAGVEEIDLNALGGVDQTTINDMTGTDLTQVTVGLAGANGAGDAAVDNVIVNGTNAADGVILFGTAGTASVIGLVPTVSVTGAEPTDLLTVMGHDGDDAIQGTAVDASISLVLDGGDGDDVLLGGAGNDTLLGGNGDDVLIGGDGTDILDGGPGSNFIIQ